MSSKPYKFSVDEILKQNSSEEVSRLITPETITLSLQTKHPEDSQINDYNLQLIRAYQKLIDSQKNSSSKFSFF
jgi:hypothetical protein